MNNKQLFRSILLIVLVLAVGIGIAYSYAYFSPVTIGNGNTNSITAANFSVDFATSRYISNLSGTLIDDNLRSTSAEHTDFTVTPTGNVNIKYDIYLSSISISNNLKSSYLKWELLENNIVINYGNFSDIGSATQLKLNTDIITSSSAKSYVLRLWLSSSTANQNSLLNGTFSAKVKVISANN